MKRFPGLCTVCNKLGLMDGCISIYGDALFRYHKSCIEDVIKNPHLYNNDVIEKAATVKKVENSENKKRKENIKFLKVHHET